MWSRRSVVFGMAGGLLLPNTMMAEAGFRAWLAAFSKRAARSGIRPATLRSLGAVEYLPKVVAFDRKPAETAKPLAAYLASAASAARLSGGRAMLRRHAALFDRLEARFGVSRYILTAIWGMESSYGHFRGNTPVLSALASLAYEGRRREVFEAELLAALKILQTGEVSAAHLLGSYAGAMGHTQMMPSSFLQHAVDFDGDGRRDIWAEDPTDALASTAHYLAQNGWSKGPRWGQEVVLPRGFDLALTGRIYPRTAAKWARLGVLRADGRPLSGARRGAVILPAGPEGPALMIYDNFHVIKTYNYADSYAISVGHLSDRLAGEGPFRTTGRADPWGMSTAERITLQKRLNAAGFAAGRPDGVIGEKGRAAIRAFERSRGMRETGVPSVELLRRLR